MTALAANAARESRNLGSKREYQVAGSTTVYAGSLMMIKSDGYAAPAAASASNQGCVGVATEAVDNSGGADGALKVEIQEGEFLLAADSIAITSVNVKCYADDDNTIDETQASNCPQAGVLTQVVSASQGWVAVGVAFSGQV